MRQAILRAWSSIRSSVGAEGALATGSLLGLGLGFWMAWPPLGLIVPCGIVFVLLLYAHLRGGPE